jgi:hypothetical protein
VDRLLVALAIAVAVAAIALVARRRRPDAPTGPAGRIPAQLDRGDFDRPEAPWLVVAFTSATCDACRDVVGKLAALPSDEVAVAIVEYPERRSLHERYAIEAVPLVLVADRRGVVHAHFLGPATATDLWNAVARVRDGGGG